MDEKSVPKVLVVDDRSQFPRVDLDYAELVDFHTSLPDPWGFDFSSYGAVFAHERNEASESGQEALERDEIEALFVFSGNEEVDHLGPRYTLPRSVFRERFGAFLRRYSDGAGAVGSAEVFTVGGEGQSEQPSRRSDSSLDPGDLGVINFRLEEHKPSQEAEEWRSVTIRRRGRDTSRKIDYRRTLKPLQEIKEPHLILLEEEYLREGDGLDLLLHLRLEAGYPFSRFPVAVRLRRPLEEWVRQHPKYSILATEKVFPLSPGSSLDLSNESQYGSLDTTQHLGILERLPLSPENLTGRHDLANEWGPVRLHQGLRRMWEESHEHPERIKKATRQLAEKPYYKYLSALIALRQKEGDSSQSASPDGVIGEANSVHEQWCEILKDQSDPLRILIVDDEADAGWTDAIQELFLETTQEGRVEAITDTGETNHSSEALANRISSGDWDLALIDLRLTQEDQRLGSRHVERLSGTQLIRKLKETRPDLPVVAVTASNKAWTAKALRDVGADGYWVKENPQYGVSQEYTIENATDLVRTLTSAVRRYKDARPIWRLYDHLEECRKETSYVYRWVELIKNSDQKLVKRHLQAIQNRLLRAHGFLVMRNRIQNHPEYEYRPEDITFLTIWGVLNEILSLHFEDPPYHQATPLKKPSGTFRFRLFDPKEKEIVKYWEIQKGKIEESNLNIPDGIEKDLRPTKEGDPVYPSGSRVDNQRISLLLYRSGGENDVDRFNELRKLRNTLEEAHGDATGARHASLKDIKDLTSLWMKILTN